MALATVTLEPMTEGDTWAGITRIGPLAFRHYDPDDSQAGDDDYVIDDPPGVVDSVKLHFAKEGFYTAVLKCESSGDPGTFPITIVSGDQNSGDPWTFSVPVIADDEFPLRAGTWLGELEVVYGGGVRKTLLMVRQVVNPQITK